MRAERLSGILSRAGVISWLAILTIAPAAAVDFVHQAWQSQAVHESLDSVQVFAFPDDRLLVTKHLGSTAQVYTGLAELTGDGDAIWSRTMSGSGLIALNADRVWFWSETGILTSLDRHGRSLWRLPLPDLGGKLKILTRADGTAVLVGTVRIASVSPLGEINWSRAYDQFPVGGFPLDAAFAGQGDLLVVLHQWSGFSTNLFRLGPAGVVSWQTAVDYPAKLPQADFRSGNPTRVWVATGDQIRTLGAGGAPLNQWIPNSPQVPGGFYTVNKRALAISANDQLVLVAESGGSVQQTNVVRYAATGQRLWALNFPHGSHRAAESISSADSTASVFLAHWNQGPGQNLLRIRRINAQGLIEQLDLSGAAPPVFSDNIFSSGMRNAYAVGDRQPYPTVPEIYRVTPADLDDHWFGSPEFPHSSSFNQVELAAFGPHRAALVVAGTVASSRIAPPFPFISLVGSDGRTIWTRNIPHSHYTAGLIAQGSDRVFHAIARPWHELDQNWLHVIAVDAEGEIIWSEPIDQGGFVLHHMHASVDDDVLISGENRRSSSHAWGVPVGVSYRLSANGMVRWARQQQGVAAGSIRSGMLVGTHSITAGEVMVSAQAGTADCEVVRQDSTGHILWSANPGQAYFESRCLKVTGVSAGAIWVAGLVRNSGTWAGALWLLDATTGATLGSREFTPAIGMQVEDLSLGSDSGTAVVAFRTRQVAGSNGGLILARITPSMNLAWQVAEAVPDLAAGPILSVRGGRIAVGGTVQQGASLYCPLLRQYSLTGKPIPEPWTGATACGARNMLALTQDSDGFILAAADGVDPENLLPGTRLATFSDVIYRNGFQ